MTLWARLTWQAADAAALGIDLGRRLGVDPAPHPALPGSFVLALGTAVLEVVPWRREAPSDEPRAAGRLVFEPIEGGLPEPVPFELPPLVLAGVGWATVELDRAAAELEAWLEPAPGHDPGDDGRDPHLGARTRVRDATGLPGGVLVLSEPVTEGSLAASLALDGEGPCALYLWPSAGLEAWLAGARARGVSVSRSLRGPFGRSVLLPGAAVAGPHVIVVEAPQASSAAGAPGTIEP